MRMDCKYARAGNINEIFQIAVFQTCLQNNSAQGIDMRNGIPAL
jgi:hypothetical protein